MHATSTLFNKTTVWKIADIETSIYIKISDNPVQRRAMMRLYALLSFYKTHETLFNDRDFVYALALPVDILYDADDSKISAGSVDITTDINSNITFKVPGAYGDCVLSLDKVMSDLMCLFTDHYKNFTVQEGILKQASDKECEYLMGFCENNNNIDQYILLKANKLKIVIGESRLVTTYPIVDISSISQQYISDKTNTVLEMDYDDYTFKPSIRM